MATRPLGDVERWELEARNSSSACCAFIFSLNRLWGEEGRSGQ